jgi:hypothetical protein
MMSIRLVAEKRFPFAISEISERKLFARRANSACRRGAKAGWRAETSRAEAAGRL